MSRILMVDTDATVLSDNRLYFERLGYQVICARTAAEAERIINSAALDCMILDVDLPDEDGFSLCARVREKTGLPIVFLSAYTEASSRIRGFSIGADDYVCKPYSLVELELRVRARIKAGRITEPPKPLHFGQLAISPATRCVSYGSASVTFSAYEFDLLYFLARHPGEMFTYEQIFDHVWKSPVNRGLKSLQMIVVRIRQKLLELQPAHDYIQTIRRKGYLFIP